MKSELIAKYDVPVPRYTSYPTVPYWEGTPDSATWFKHIEKALSQVENKWSMYLHVPFCESLCTYCGCNTSITKDHGRELPYIENLLQEFSVYTENVKGLSQRPLHHLHFGGGTPTFLSAQNLRTLLTGIYSKISIDQNHFEGSIEVDPRRTSAEQLEVLREFSFNRVSMGVQDFDPEVQRLVNRIQPLEMTRALTDQARNMGYTSVNFDLIYGLAKQTPQSIEKTAKLTAQLRPDRIALYSLALVPWIKPQQRLFKDEDLPKADEKRKLYEIAREILLSEGYLEIGMDHFALPDDNLAKAMLHKKLHRNFMGYTDQRTEVLLGLGVSAISETPWSFHQNEKVLPVYTQKVQGGQLPTFRGHLHDEEDLIRREQILEFMGRFETTLHEPYQVNQAREFLAEMIRDGLVELKENQLLLTEKGRPFLRNACLFFDERLKRKMPSQKIFSGSI